MSLPDLIPLDRAIQNATLANVNTANPGYLGSLISAASGLVRHWCHRDFSQTPYTEYHSGGIYVREPMRLRQYPVLEITRVATSPRPALLVQNVNGNANQRATVETTPTALRLVRIASAVASTVDLTWATSPTLTALAAAVNAQGAGWSASIVDQFSLWPSADLKPLQGAVTALQGGTQLELYAEDVQPFFAWPPGESPNDEAGYLASCGWRLDDETGELFGRFPRGQLNLRIDYIAGFATIPQPVQEACVQLALDLYNAGLINTTLKKATLGGSSFEVASQTTAATLSGKVQMLLAGYVDHSRAIAR